MNMEAELVEVARHLPKEAAQLLEVQPWRVQERVLVLLRELMCVWEAAGANFDPIQWELAITGVVAVITPMQVEILNTENLVEMMLGG